MRFLDNESPTACSALHSKGPIHFCFTFCQSKFVSHIHIATAKFLNVGVYVTAQGIVVSLRQRYHSDPIATYCSAGTEVLSGEKQLRVILLLMTQDVVESK